MQITVIGGSGFLGSHTADALSAAKHRVRIMDRQKSPFLRQDQEMILGDVLDRKALEKAVQGSEAVYSFAGLADVDECASKPVETVEMNVLANVYALEAARKARVSRYIFSSSVYVYSNRAAFYRASKLACEAYIEDYQRQFGLAYTILRFGSLYGERADARNSVYRILKEAITTGKITCYGSGEEVREFIHVKDAAQSCVDILSSEYENEHVMLTGQQAIQYKRLYRMIEEMLTTGVKTEYKPRQSAGHYEVTPYSFTPKFAKKMSPTKYIDLGQGLLQCMSEIMHELDPKAFPKHARTPSEQ